MVAYTFYEADNRVRRYAEALVKRGDQVDAVALRREGQQAFEVIRGVHVYRIQNRVIDESGPFSYLIKLLMFFLRSAWMLAVTHLKAPYDIIHVHSVPDFEVFATIVPRLMGAKVILDIHDIVPEFYASKFGVSEHSLTFRLLVLVEAVSAAYSNHVIISNDLWHTKIISRSVRSEKCTAIINYPDSSIFSPRPRTLPDKGDFVMCYPGTLNRHQGLDLAIDAVALLRDKVPHLKLLIIGDGPDREKLKTIIRQRRLEDRVALRGFIPIEQVAETMATVDLGIVPKRSDSFGNEAFSTKVMEFMAMGTPVVVSRTRIDQHYFNDQIVQFFDPGNVDDLAAKVLELVRDPVKCDSLRASAAKFVGQNVWGVKKGVYLDLVDHLAHNRRGARAAKSTSVLMS